MRVKVEKTSQGKVLIELVTDPAKKPVRFELKAEDVKSLAQILTNAAAADRFMFILEI